MGDFDRRKSEESFSPEKLSRAANLLLLQEWEISHEDLLQIGLDADEVRRIVAELVQEEPAVQASAPAAAGDSYTRTNNHGYAHGTPF